MIETTPAFARDVASIGEGQLRLVTATGTALEQASQLSVTVAGTEGNVMGLLARLGNRTGLITAVPATPLGRRVIADYRSAGIDTGAVIWSESGRLALYFHERSSAPVPSRVIYDRSDSCFAGLRAQDVNWRYLIDARLVHLTGITACLTDSTFEIVSEAVDRARKVGRGVSIDVNYRAQLATPAVARRRLSPLLQAADVIFCSRRDAANVFGIRAEVGDVAQQLATRFGAETVVVSDSARAVATFFQGQLLTAQPPHTTVIDRVGAGDALVGGFLHGWLRDDPEAGLKLGVAAAALALTRLGDQLHTSLEELAQLTASFGQDIIR